MIKIVGAGIAGLLAVNMLRHRSPFILEKQSQLPNNHSAVLRFRSHIVGDVTGIEFKKVSVLKSALHWKNPIADALAYAYKNTGMMRSDRSISTELKQTERYIAPLDFIERLACNSNIHFDILDAFEPNRKFSNHQATISTIPMPALMDILGYPHATINFASISGTNLIAKVDHCDAYASLYTPSPFYPFSRISLTGDELVAEIPSTAVNDPEIIYAAAALLGIDKHRLTDIRMREQKYAKILPIDDGERKRFIAWASDEHNIYSLGRFACWRPSTLLDDLVQDIRLIERWIVKGQYAKKIHNNRKEAL